MQLGRRDIEQALLADPFNADLRAQYAHILLAAGEYDPAAVQYQLLRKQAPDSAAGFLGHARALLALGRTSEAQSAYALANGKNGFSMDEQLEPLAARESREGPVRLTVVSGGREGASRSSNVVDLVRVDREKISFSDIAGLDDLKRTVKLQIVEPFLRPSLFARFKKKAGGGVLLYGPPGCGKTMLARAIATEVRAEFISVGISDVLNMYIGESGKNLAALFEKARKSQPCVLFFDEIDALAYARSKAQSEHTRQVVNEFLAQLDGMGNENQGLLVLAATNMPWDVDAAMKRPGRFSRQVFVAPPDAAARAHIVNMKLEGVPHEQIDATRIADSTQHYSGADIDGLVEVAKDYALEDQMRGNAERGISQADLVRAVSEMRPSTLDWLRTARNLVKYAGADDTYREVDQYLKAHKIS